MEKEKKIRKNDWLLLVIVLSAAVLISVMRFVVGDKHPGYVTVRIDGDIVQTFDLSKDTSVKLNGGTNTMVIEDGKVKMAAADCPDKLCVHQKAISKNGQSIICLPNRVVLQIVNQDESKIDAVTN